MSAFRLPAPASALNDVPFRLTSDLKLGPPTLRVREVKSALDFYERDLGLIVKGRNESQDGLEVIQMGFRSKTEPLLLLKHDPGASRPPHNFAGLYHYAVLFPSRKDLASTFLAVGNSGVVYEGYADHTFSEAIYLHDSENNGIELYADRPRSSWPKWDELDDRSGGARRFASLNGPLDLDSLLRELANGERANPAPFPHGARIGHMHLRVTDLKKSVDFYHSKLGFDITMYFPEIGAAFLSVGGYHHHLGLNTWHSSGGSRHMRGEAGLEDFKIMLPSSDELAAVSKRFPESSPRGRSLTVEDPDGIGITFET